MSTRDKGIDAALWVLCLDCLVLIIWNSAGDAPAAFDIPHADKALHLVSYFSLTLLLLLAAVWRPGRGPSGFGDIGRTVIVAVGVFGILIEVAQGLLFERTADAVDAVMNIAGCLLAWALWMALRRSSMGSGATRSSG